MRTERTREKSRFLPFWLLVLFFLPACHSADSEPSEAPATSAMTVTAHQVARVTMKDELVVSGTVEPWQTLTVASELGGLPLVRVEAEIGDRVTRGQPLAYLEDRDLRAQLKAAEARYRSAVANLSRSRRPDRPQQIAALEAQVEQAKSMVSQENANLRQAKIQQANSARTAERYQEALEKGFVTALETDQRVTDKNAQLASIRAAEQRLRAAHFALKQAQQNLKLAQAGGRSEDVSMAQAQADEAQATVERLSVQLEKTVIRAPDSGLVLSQKAFLGNTVKLGDELYTLARQSRLQLWAEVPQDRLLDLRPGDQLRLSAGDIRETGRVEEIDPTIDPQTRQGRVRVGLPQDTRFRAGAFVRGNLEEKTVEVPAVPAEAVQGPTGEQYVFLLEGNKVRKQVVDAGRRQEQSVEIRGGLELGQTVVVSGAAFLTDGDTVEVAKP